MDMEMWVIFGLMVAFVFAVSFFRKDAHNDTSDYDRRTVNEVGMDSSYHDWGSSSSESGSDSCDSGDSGDSSCDSGSSSDD